MRRVQTRFATNRDYDAFQIWVSLRFSGADDFLSLCESFGLDATVGRRIRESGDYDGCDDLVNGVVAERYERDGHLLEWAEKSYGIEWGKINDIFYSGVADITGFDWQFDEYEVILSLFHTGISNRDANFVLRSAREDAREQTRITAHEILMIQMWNIFEQLLPADRLKRKEKFFWSANEITTTAILGLDPKLDALWTDKQKGFDGFLLNYPDMKNLKEILKKKYLEADSFREYAKYVDSFAESAPAV